MNSRQMMPKKAKRRPGLGPSSLRVKKNTWRAKQYRIPFSSYRTFFVTVRKRRTTQSRRSQKYRQLIIPFRIFGIKEVAIRQKVSGLYGKHSYGPERTFSLASVMVLVGLSGFLFFGFQLLGVGSVKPPIVTAVSSPEEKLPETKKSEFLKASKPIHIEIPAIDVETDIVKVGLDEKGEIGTPDLFSRQVGWYKYSPTPGEIGPSVMVGHVDTYKGPSIFWNLGRLRPGNKIRITRNDEKTVTFVVTGVNQFKQNEFPTKKVYGNIKFAGLRLITCGGNYSHLSNRYSANTVVFAKMIKS